MDTGAGLPDGVGVVEPSKLRSLSRRPSRNLGFRVSGFGFRV